MAALEIKEQGMIFLRSHLRHARFLLKEFYLPQIESNPIGGQK
jgi:hypothetical protein